MKPSAGSYICEFITHIVCHMPNFSKVWKGQLYAKKNKVSKSVSFSIEINRKKNKVNISINKKKIDLNFVEFISLNERVQTGLTQINMGKWNKPFICVYHRSFNFSIEIKNYEELANEMNAIATLVIILNESTGPIYENNNYAEGLRTLSTNWFHPR